MLSPSLTRLLPLSFTQEMLRLEARKRADKMSIQGVQPKLSARLDVKGECFEVVDRQGEYILKPQIEQYEQTPENEDLSMRLAKAAGIEVPFHGLVYANDDSLVYFIKRFDRAKNKKIAVEDFAQLGGMNRDTKYSYSMEKVVKIIEANTTFPMIDKADLFLRVIVNYIIGNEDMHLKNYSLIVNENKISLAPAYDFLNTTMALGVNHVREEIALSLNGKKNNLRKRDLIDYFGEEKLGLPSVVIEQQLKKVWKAQDKWSELIERSFLSKALKEEYRAIIQEKSERLRRAN